MNTAERDILYVRHILECIDKIETYIQGDNNRIYHDSMLQDATLRVLQTMAESCQRLSEEFKSAHAQIDWRGISGFRNILVHDYLGGIDIALVWQVIEQDLPALKNFLQKSSSNQH